MQGETMLSNLKGLLTNKMPFAERQYQKHVADVDTNNHKANLSEQINHCGKRPSTRALAMKVLLQLDQMLVDQSVQV